MRLEELLFYSVGEIPYNNPWITARISKCQGLRTPESTCLILLLWAMDDAPFVVVIGMQYGVQFSGCLPIDSFCILIS